MVKYCETTSNTHVALNMRRNKIQLESSNGCHFVVYMTCFGVWLDSVVERTDDNDARLILSVGKQLPDGRRSLDSNDFAVAKLAIGHSLIAARGLIVIVGFYKS